MIIHTSDWGLSHKSHNRSTNMLDQNYPSELFCTIVEWSLKPVSHPIKPLMVSLDGEILKNVFLASLASADCIHVPSGPCSMGLRIVRKGCAWTRMTNANSEDWIEISQSTGFLKTVTTGFSDLPDLAVLINSWFLSSRKSILYSWCDLNLIKDVVEEKEGHSLSIFLTSKQTILVKW